MKHYHPFLSVLLALALLTSPVSQAAGAKKNKVRATESAVAEQKSVSSKAFSYQVGARPLFVEAVTAPNIQKAQGSAVGDQYYSLIDRQMSLLDGQKVDYFHYKSKVLTRQALQDASQVYINFNPEYEKLTLHSIRLWRDGHAMELTDKVKLDLMQRERNLEKNMYEGEVTALGVLPGVEVGDEVELEYSTAGSNPILGNLYSGLFSITQAAFVQHYSLRIYTPDRRSLNVVPPVGVNVVKDVAGGVLRYVVEADKIAPVLSEDSVPPWFNPFKLVQVSEYASWGQVATWARGLFAQSEPLSPLMQKKVDDWKASGLSKEALVPEVLRWVQSDIRYFGIELGVNSHLPSKPSETMARKYGDCKDKTLLMHALLNALDIQSFPVLASLRYQRNTAKMIPSAAVFDHAILKVVLNDKAYWLDATATPQWGTLNKLSFYEYGGVLALTPQASELETIAYQNGIEDKYVSNYDFKIRGYNQPVELTARLITTGNYADYFRKLFQEQSVDEFSKFMQQDLLKMYPDLRETKATEFKEDLANNEVTIVCHYNLNQFLSYEPGRFEAPILAIDLLPFARLPGTPRREYPYAMLHHVSLVQNVTLDFPNDPSLKPTKRNKTDNGDFWNLATSVQLQNQSVNMSWELKANKEAVLPQQMEKYISETRKVRDAMGLSFRLPVGDLTDAEQVKLMKQLRAYNRYGETESSRVKAEMREVINLQAVSKDIDSGKLYGAKLAKAYQLRASAKETSGDVPAALSDIHQAQVLAPEEIEYRRFEAEVLVGDAQFASAKAIYSKLLQQAMPEKEISPVHKGLGQALFYLGEHTEAVKHFEMAKSAASKSEVPYILLWQYLAEASLDMAAAQAHLTRDLAENTERDWPLPVLEMLSGRLTPQQLIAKVDSKDVGVREDHLSEAYYYIGKQYQFAQDASKAKDAFRKCLDQNVSMFIENSFALYELGQRKQLKKEGFFSGF